MTAALPVPIPAALRARGGVRLEIGVAGGRSAALGIAESAGYRVRFPRVPGPYCEGVLINTGGGLAGGDLMRVEARLRAGARACLTTQAAEKVYRSEGASTEIEVALTLDAGSRLAWLPQEQILFDGARLRRTLKADLAADAVLTLVESAAFGRLARGERMETGAFRDRWRIRRDGRLVFAEEVRLENPHAVLARPALGNGACAVATGLHAAPGAEGLVEGVRAALDGAECEWGLSGFDGLLLARFLGADPWRVRAALARFVLAIRGAPPPRSWQT